jgi:hypothetical protein
VHKTDPSVGAQNWSIDPYTKLINRSIHKTITDTTYTSKNTARNYLCQFHLRTLLCSCVLWHIVFLWVLYFRRDIVLPSSRNTYPLKLHHCCHTFGPFIRSHSSAARPTVPAQQLPSDGTRPAGNKPTHCVQCVCPFTPTTTPIFAMIRLQKPKEINSVRFSSWNFLIRSKVFIHVPLKWSFLKICTENLICIWPRIIDVGK